MNKNTIKKNKKKKKKKKINIILIYSIMINTSFFILLSYLIN